MDSWLAHGLGGEAPAEPVFGMQLGRSLASRPRASVTARDSVKAVGGA